MSIKMSIGVTTNFLINKFMVLGSCRFFNDYEALSPPIPATQACKTARGQTSVTALVALVNAV